MRGGRQVRPPVPLRERYTRMDRGRVPGVPLCSISLALFFSNVWVPRSCARYHGTLHPRRYTAGVHVASERRMHGMQAPLRSCGRYLRCRATRGP